MFRFLCSYWLFRKWLTNMASFVLWDDNIAVCFVFVNSNDKFIVNLSTSQIQRVLVILMRIDLTWHAPCMSNTFYVSALEKYLACVKMAGVLSPWVVFSFHSLNEAMFWNVFPISRGLISLKYVQGRHVQFSLTLEEYILESWCNLSSSDENSRMSRWGRGRSGSVAVPLDSALFRENSNCPTAARSAGTVGKWGITSFTSIRSAPYGKNIFPYAVALE